MRPDCAWSMSTVGLTAQETSFPIQNPFLQGGFCHSMAGSKPSLSFRHELMDNFYFSMATSTTDHTYRSPQKGQLSSNERHMYSSHRLPSKKLRPAHLSLSFSPEPSTPSPTDEDQVVPSFLKLSVKDCSSPPRTPDRCSKPLPPIPLHKDICHEQAIDNEVEFFTSTDKSCLVPSDDQCSKPSPFRYGQLHRRSFRDCGQINYAYYDGPLGTDRSGHPQQHHQVKHVQAVHGHHEQQQQKEPLEPVVCQRSQDKAQRKLRRSHSGPAGSLHKPRLICNKRHTYGTDKPEVPPPLPPRSLKTGDNRRWSAEVSSGAYSDDDKPPKVPPRDPMSRGSSRTPSPKSLIPTYVNGVMPPTQSFAPDPKYVSCRSFFRQNSEGSPCILPVMENGKKASATHYYILPQKSAFMESPCDCNSRRKEDLV
uniref:ERBB receptor feedback inhibitor 1a n=1 Tax=Oryzias latipes TaxID=8090 RepID=A0A3P9JGG6_ORYLA